MIKRRFFKIEHGDKDEVASAASSSSDSDSEIEPQASEEEEEEEEEDSADNGVSVSLEEQEDAAESNSTSSGYQSEDSSDNVDNSHFSPTGLPINEEDDEFGNERKTYIAPQIFGRTGSEFLEKSSNVEENESLPEDLPDYIFKCKSVFKCKICPRVVCLNEDTMSAHLKSKKHARSEKLLKEGRLKAMINSDGELDDEVVPAKQKAAISASKQSLKDKPNQKKGGRRRQHSRSQSNRLKKKKMRSDPDPETIKQSKGGPPRKKHKHDD